MRLSPWLALMECPHGPFRNADFLSVPREPNSDFFDNNLDTVENTGRTRLKTEVSDALAWAATEQ